RDVPVRDVRGVLHSRRGRVGGSGTRLRHARGARQGDDVAAVRACGAGVGSVEISTMILLSLLTVIPAILWARHCDRIKRLNPLARLTGLSSLPVSHAW